MTDILIGTALFLTAMFLAEYFANTHGKKGKR